MPRRVPSVETLDGDAAELKKKLRATEGEHAAFYETSQWTMRANKDSIAQLRGEIKSLKTRLTRLRKDEEQFKAKTQRTELSKMERRTEKLRNEVDNWKHRAMEREELVKTKTDELEEVKHMIPSVPSHDSPVVKQIRKLERRLDGALGRYNDALTMKKTYEQILKRLRKERLNFDAQLSGIEKAVRGREQEYIELELMHQDAQRVRERAHMDVDDFQESLTREKEKLQRQLAERRAQVQAKTEMGERIKRKKQQQEEEEARRLEEKEGFVPEGQVEESEKRITTYEEAFKRIQEATGVIDVNEVIEKFLTQGETHRKLEHLRTATQAKLDKLMAEKTIVRTEAEEAKYSGLGSEANRRELDEFETKLAEASALCDHARTAHERLCKILIGVRMGVSHLCQIIELEDVEVEDDSIAPILGLIERQVGKKYDTVALQRKQRSTVDLDASMRRTQELDERVELAPSNVRVPFHIPGMNSGDEESEESDGEHVDIVTRESMKAQSASLLGRVTRNARKGRRKGGTTVPSVRQTSARSSAAKSVTPRGVDGRGKRPFRSKR